MSHTHKILYVLLILALAYTFWPTRTGDNGDAPAWNVHVDQAGRLHVLNVVLHQTTLKQAEAELRSRSERALFIPSGQAPGKGPTIEAYFSNMPDNSKLVLGLAADAALIDKIKRDARSPFAFPSGSIKLEIASAHSGEIDGLVVDTLTYIPRIRLTLSDIETRFGKAAEQVPQKDVVHYLYPAIGLDAILDARGEAMLQFVTPGEFQRVRESLNQSSAHEQHRD